MCFSKRNKTRNDSTIRHHQSDPNSFHQCLTHKSKRELNNAYEQEPLQIRKMTFSVGNKLYYNNIIFFKNLEK